MSGIDISSHHWFLLIARPNRVFKAATVLQDRGLVTALPFEWRSRRRARHCKSVLRFPLPQLGPYLMTGFRDPRPHFRELLDDRILEPLLAGVVSVTSDGLPTPIRSKEIWRQQVRHGASLFELPPKSVIDQIEDQQLQAGDQARVGRWFEGWAPGEKKFDPGGFAGKVVTIDQIEGDMAKVLLPMFGSEYRAAVPLEHLAAA